MGNGSISFYCKSGKLASARKLPDASRFKDLVPWNSLLAEYVDRGCTLEARNRFDAMLEKDAFSLSILIDKDIACWNSMDNR